MASNLSLVIEGKIKPYVRMTQRSKWVNPQALEYLASKDAIRIQARSQMADEVMLPAKTPLYAVITICQPGIYRSDLDNIVKAIFDGLQGEAFKDDRYIVAIIASKKKTTEYQTTVIIGVVDQ